MSKKLVRIAAITFAVVTTTLVLHNAYHPYHHPLSPDASRLEYLTNLPIQHHINQTYTLVQSIQVHREMWEAYYLGNASKLLDASEEQKFLLNLKLREHIYPFNRKYFKSLWHLYSSYEGRGIVMTTGNWYTKYDIEFKIIDM